MTGVRKETSATGSALEQWRDWAERKVGKGRFADDESLRRAVDQQITVEVTWPKPSQQALPRATKVADAPVGAVALDRDGHLSLRVSPTHGHFVHRAEGSMHDRLDRKWTWGSFGQHEFCRVVAVNVPILSDANERVAAALRAVREQSPGLLPDDAATPDDTTTTTPDNPPARRVAVGDHVRTLDVPVGAVVRQGAGCLSMRLDDIRGIHVRDHLGKRGEERLWHWQFLNTGVSGRAEVVVLDVPQHGTMDERIDRACQMIDAASEARS